MISVYLLLDCIFPITSEKHTEAKRELVGSQTGTCRKANGRQTEGKRKSNGNLSEGKRSLIRTFFGHFLKKRQKRLVYMKRSSYLCTRLTAIELIRQLSWQSTTLLMLGSWVRAPSGSLKEIADRNISDFCIIYVHVQGFCSSIQ